MSYTIMSKDSKRAVFINRETNDIFVVNSDMKASGTNELFVTDDKELAESVWKTTGGEYGDFEIRNND